MRALAIIGGTGRGKTTFVKNEIISKLNVNPIVYDTQNEYYANSKLPSMDSFVTLAENSKHKVFIFEESRMFFRHRGKINERVENLLISKRHSKNFYIFIFHALHQIPIDILDYINDFVLFKTDEREDYVFKKFGHSDKIIQSFKEVDANPNHYFYKEF